MNMRTFSGYPVIPYKYKVSTYAQTCFAWKQPTNRNRYGMITLAYPFFFEGAATIGRLSRYGHPISTSMVRKQLIAEMGTTWFFAGGG